MISCLGSGKVPSNSSFIAVQVSERCEASSEPPDARDILGHCHRSITAEAYTMVIFVLA